MSNQILDISHWFFTKREKLIFGPGNREVDKTAWKKSNAAFGLSGPKFYTNKRLYFMTVLAIDLCYHGDMTMSVLEKGNSQLPVRIIVYHLGKLEKTSRRKNFFFTKSAFFSRCNYIFSILNFIINMICMKSP